MSAAKYLPVVKTVAETKLPKAVQDWVAEVQTLTQPEDIYVCNGSKAEADIICKIMQDNGNAKPLAKYNNCWITRTDPADVARVESKTVIVTPNKHDAVPEPKKGVKGELDIWMSPEQFDAECAKRWPACMKGRTLFVVPFCMGPIGSPLAKLGVQVTDWPYVVASMGIMARMGDEALAAIEADPHHKFTMGVFIFSHFSFRFFSSFSFFSRLKH